MIRFVEKKAISFSISSILFIASVILLFTIGLKPNIEFTGGSLMEVGFVDARPSVDDVQEALKPLNLGEIVVQPVNDDGHIIKMRFISEEEHQTVLKTIREKFGKKEDRPTAKVETNSVNQEIITEAAVTTDEITGGVLEKRIETIGPAVSSYLKARAFKAAAAVILVIIAFIAFSFRKVSKPVASWKYGLAAVIALIHDVTITMGVFVLLGFYLNVEVGISFVVAALTILGYSVNDTIVVYDRIREKLIRRGSDKFTETVNVAINETLTRSLITSLVTLLVLFSLFLFGGESIKFFALALIVGIFFGTYSSIFVAAPLLVSFNRK